MTTRPEPEVMTAMVLEGAGPRLKKRTLPRPEPGPGQLLIRVAACAVCRTDLHIVDGDLPDAGRPRVPGHEVIGRVVSCGAGVRGFAPGARVGVPWLGFACGRCDYCRAGQENLCAGARFTGYHMDGGFAEHMVADARFCFAIPDVFDDQAAAPLMCAGLIGYRALRMAGDITGEARRIGLYGFGAAAHIITQVALFQGRQIYAFTRPGDSTSQAFARKLGACWAGTSDQKPPDELDAAILFAPVGALVPAALAAIRRAGVVVCAGIHMSDIPRFAYRLLWGERMVRSVANLTRRDGEEFLALAARAGVRTTTHRYGLDQANAALDDLRAGRFEGAAVLIP